MGHPSHRHVLNYARAPLVAIAALVKHRFVGLDHQHAGAAADSWGVTDTAWAIGDCYNVVMMGTCVIEASEAITPGQQVQSDATGKAAVGTTNVLGRALGTAAGDGDHVEILLSDLTK